METGRASVPVLFFMATTEWQWRIVAIQDKPSDCGFSVMGVVPTTEEIIFTTEFTANSVVEARYKSMLFINKSDVAGLFKNMANWRDANKKMMVRKHRRENPSWYHLRLISLNRDTYI